jgi:hypothetical protein
MSQILIRLMFAASMTAVPFDEGSDRPPPPPDGHHHHAPPREAIDACASLKTDDACTFKLHDHEITGTCKARPDDASALACRPDHRPGPDAPPPPPQ